MCNKHKIYSTYNLLGSTNTNKVILQEYVSSEAT